VFISVTFHRSSRAGVMDQRGAPYWKYSS